MMKWPCRKIELCLSWPHPANTTSAVSLEAARTGKYYWRRQLGPIDFISSFKLKHIFCDDTIRNTETDVRDFDAVMKTSWCITDPEREWGGDLKCSRSASKHHLFIVATKQQHTHTPHEHVQQSLAAPWVVFWAGSYKPRANLLEHGHLLEQKRPQPSQEGVFTKHLLPPNTGSLCPAAQCLPGQRRRHAQV